MIPPTLHPPSPNNSNAIACLFWSLFLPGGSSNSYELSTLLFITLGDMKEAHSCGLSLSALTLLVATNAWWLLLFLLVCSTLSTNSVLDGLVCHSQPREWCIPVGKHNLRLARHLSQQQVWLGLSKVSDRLLGLMLRSQSRCAGKSLTCSPFVLSTFGDSEKWSHHWLCWLPRRRFLNEFTPRRLCLIPFLHLTASLQLWQQVYQRGMVRQGQFV